MTVFIFNAPMTKKMIASLLEADGITMPVNGMCQMMWTETCSKIGGLAMQVASLILRLSNVY